MKQVQIKRVYEPPDMSDGCRILVDRLWPRGLTRNAAVFDHWMKELGPSTELRKWFDHRTERWEEFVRRYRIELGSDAAQVLMRDLKALSVSGPLTLLYSARDETRNQAVVIAELLRAGSGNAKQ